MERLKKSSILLLALTIVLASCSSQTEDFSGPERQTAAGEQRVTDPMAVGFDAYTQRDITRAGYKGDAARCVGREVHRSFDAGSLRVLGHLRKREIVT